MENDIIIEEGDIVISSCGRLGTRVNCGISNGGHIGTFDTIEQAISAATGYMEKNQIWPTMWYVSDHGNFWPIDKNGNEIK